MKLTFYGGVGEVTGANYLLENGSSKFLVDCGLHQGEEAEEKNLKPFSYNPKSIEAVFITHAHIDHIGRLPQLVKEGFKGKIFSTKPTKDLALPMLIDELKIMLAEKEKSGKEPLFLENDILNTMRLWEVFDYKENFSFGDLDVSFLSAGHILGAASVLISFQDKKIVFSGDLGNKKSVFIQPFEKIKEADFVIMESTYGGRKHRDLERRKEILLNYVRETIKNKRILLIPAFALQRTQELVYELNDIVENKLKSDEKIKVFVDGPLVFELFDVYKKYSKNSVYFNEKAINIQKKGDDIFNFSRLKIISSKKESKKIFQEQPPKIIIAASGMSSGGRVLFHELEYLKNPLTTFLIFGYQASGTLGRKLLDGAKKINILGKEVNVKARIESTDGYSAHADNDDLLDWLFSVKRERLKSVFLVQGDKESSLALAQEIKKRADFEVRLPKEGESVIL